MANGQRRHGTGDPRSPEQKRIDQLGYDPEQKRFDPTNDTSFIAWLLSQGYRPAYDQTSGELFKDHWLGPGQDITRSNQGKGILYKRLMDKEGAAWQADIMASQLMNEYGLQANERNPFGLPYDPNLITAESKMAALQLMINQLERDEFLGNRERAVSEIRSTLDSPTFQAMRDTALRRLENPDVYSDQDYERMAVGAQEANARALRDNLEAIRANFAGRGLGGSGGQAAIESTTYQDAGRRILENRRATDEMRARNRAEGLNIGFNQANQAQSYLDNVYSQISSLYGGIPEKESEFGGLASALNTMYGGFRSGSGNL